MLSSSEFLNDFKEKEKLISEEEAQKQLRKLHREEKRAKRQEQERPVPLMPKKYIKRFEAKCFLMIFTLTK